jgi:hypothetical protein
VLAVRNRKLDAFTLNLAPAASARASAYDELVEYCEYLLVLAPEPLWQLWKKAPHGEEHISPSAGAVTQPADFNADDVPE